MDIDGRCYNRPCVDVHATERMVDVVDIAITINTGVDIWCVTEALRTMMHMCVRWIARLGTEFMVRL